jgi:hypothetical protein
MSWDAAGYCAIVLGPLAFFPDIAMFVEGKSLPVRGSLQLSDRQQGSPRLATLAGEYTL